MRPFLLCALAMLLSFPVAARQTLVCQISAMIPYSTDRHTRFGETRVFTQVADLLEERRSGNSVINRWQVIADRPDQLMAVDTVRSLTLTIDRPGNTFAESGVMVQRRGYCRVNELP
jgi:hypothetical protein